jgi:MSHA biogenesis protein MshG
MQKAGVPLLRALSVIRVGKPDSQFNGIIDQLRSDVQAGKSLSEAMGEFPRTFSRVYVASVAAGEESGRLEETLDQLSSMLEQELELTRQIKQATRYPIIVVGVICLAFIIMMTVVVPRFVNFYAAFDAALPLPTRILIGASDALTRYWPIALGLLAAGAFGFHQLLTTERGRFWFDGRMLNLPVVGQLINRGNIARFALMFRILFQAGIPLVRTLEVLAGTIRNTQIALEVRKLEDLFRKGRDLGTVRSEFKYFPDMSLYMMAIGMESGSLEQTMQQVGEHYSRETLYRSRQLTSVLEPILTLVLGAFVLVLALAIFLPMWSIIKVFHN